MSTLREEWTELETKIDTVTEEIGRISRSNEGCKRLMGVPGIGPIISTALVAAVGNAAAINGGVGYEAIIISGQLAEQISQGKFIPLLRAGN